MIANAVHAYRKAWKALNTMLEEGRSYSGFERNSAFLNIGNAPDGSPRYADISGASGLDVMDDGRSIGVVDWDYDGKLDFWVTNRNGPRLRLQHNQSKTRNTFVALKLLGANAIGARVTFTINGKRRIRTVRAGHGFLSQSSTWLHVGLKEGEQITKAEVRWPGSSNQSKPITGITPGQFFTLRLGESIARRWQPPNPTPLPKAAPQPKASQRSRTVMASRLPFPPATYTTLDGSEQSLQSTGKPMLLNLWATWCAPCLSEMQEWTTHQKRLTETGISVVALSVDEDTSTVRPYLKKIGFPFASGFANPAVLETLEVAGRAQIDKFESFPIPSSILLDQQGRIAIVYKGPVSAEQLAKDTELLKADSKTLHDEAVHFPGLWIDGPWPATPTVMIDKFMSFGNPEAAKSYLDAFTVASDKRASQGLAESYFLVANELRLQRNEAAALTAYAKALGLDPHKTRIHLEMGTIHFKHRRFTEAAPHLRAAVQAQPDVNNTRKMLSLALIQSKLYAEAVPHLTQLVRADNNDSMAHLWLGHALVRVRKADEAVDHFKTSLRLQPDSFVAANELAWLLATHSSSKIRNPKEALALATKSATSTGARNAGVLDTLAAALAATGDFDAALKTVDQAINLAKESKDQKLLVDLQRRQGIYQQKRPYREISPSRD
ncbi:redoxin family protein [bacterium]|nr:redoxin family protein [bacterium]